MLRRRRRKLRFRQAAEPRPAPKKPGYQVEPPRKGGGARDYFRLVAEDRARRPRPAPPPRPAESGGRAVPPRKPAVIVPQRYEEPREDAAARPAKRKGFRGRFGRFGRAGRLGGGYGAQPAAFHRRSRHAARPPRENGDEEDWDEEAGGEDEEELEDRRARLAEEAAARKAKNNKLLLVGGGAAAALVLVLVLVFTAGGGGGSAVREFNAEVQRLGELRDRVKSSSSVTSETVSLISQCADSCRRLASLANNLPLTDQERDLSRRIMTLMAKGLDECARAARETLGSDITINPAEVFNNMLDTVAEMAELQQKHPAGRTIDASLDRIGVRFPD